ncbi:beta-lactamase/transpeptidase-like protein [Biscogniauxia marginata]|nr:beta-lactamase/transpeptidase-like protein [Biscogniauxia marginata]
MYFQASVVKALLPAFLVGDVVLGALNGHCPPLGPVLPAPASPSTHGAVQSAVAAIINAFQETTAALNSTGISVAVKSIHETSPLLDLHYTPPNLNATGTTKVDAQSIYRIGSISKIFPILALLTQKSVRLDDPITKYVPELLQLKGEETDGVNDITTVHWDQVTLGALASHMSGIGTDLVSDLATYPADWTRLGLPELGNESRTGCAGVLGLPPCDRAQFFRDFGKRHPVFAPFSPNAVYSNVASVILGYAVEAIANTTYDKFIHQSILAPLGMSNTSIFNPPENNAWGFIPAGDTWWGDSLGYEDIAGGFYSNTVDLLSFGSGILEHRLIDPVKTRKWMKPVTSTSSTGLLLGGPWEILRSDNVTKDRRLVEFYTKSGNINVYNNVLCLIPDYDLVITILTGGAESSSNLVESILTQVVQALLPTIEDAGKAEAETNFGGNYTDAATNSSITLSTDDAPGFAVSNWVIRGVDIIENYSSFATLSSAPPDLSVSLRLYPTNLAAGTQAAWRAVFDIDTPEQLAEKEASTFWPGSSCHTWANMDRLVYGFRSMDEFIFDVGEGGQVESLGLRAFQVNLDRES